MITIGCDPSSKKLAFTILEDGDLLEVRRVGIIKTGLAYRLSRAYDVTFTIFDELAGLVGDPMSFWIEEPVVGVGGPYATILQSHISGAVMAGALKGGADDVQKVYPMSWRAQVIGNTRIAKADIPKWAEANWRVQWQAACDLSKSSRPDPDVIDSGCIARYGYMRDTGLISAPVKKSRRKRRK